MSTAVAPAPSPVVAVPQSAASGRSFTIPDGLGGLTRTFEVPGGVCLERDGERGFVASALDLLAALQSPATARVAKWRAPDGSDAGVAFSERRPVTIIRTTSGAMHLVDPLALANRDPYVATFTAAGAPTGDVLSRDGIAATGAAMTIHRDCAFLPRSHGSSPDEGQAAVAVAV